MQKSLIRKGLVIGIIMLFVWASVVPITCAVDPQIPVITSPGKVSKPGTFVDTLTPTFQWNEIQDVDLYGLFISRYPYGTFQYQKEDIFGELTSFVLPPGVLEKGVMYQWIMKSYLNGVWSNPSQTLYFTTGVNGIDVSHHQGHITKDDWNDVYNDGYRFAFVKATEGGENFIRQIPEESEGIILSSINNGIKANGYTWWHVEFTVDTSVYVGWMIENVLEEINPDADGLEVGESIRTTANANLRSTPEALNPMVWDPDSEFEDNMDNATKDDPGEDPFYVGAYHFAEPNLALQGLELKQDAENEARYFLETAAPYLKEGYLRPALDIEYAENGGRKGIHAYRGTAGELIDGITAYWYLTEPVIAERLSTWIHRWMEVVINEAHVVPILYTGSYIQEYICDYLTSVNLWVSYAPSIPEPYPHTGAWSSWDFWQYWPDAPEGTVDGISTTIDVDIFNGDMINLSKFLITPNIDVVLVIDRSGSMSGSKIILAKASAKLFVDLTKTGDRVGIVSYASSVTVNHQLSEIESTATKATIKTKIDQISTGGMTAMGDALRKAYDQLIDYGDDAHPRAIILLSNGWHNYGAEHPNQVIPDLHQKFIKVYTVGLGAGANENLLRHIAKETGGFYSFAPTPFQLLEIYNDLAGRITRQQVITSIIGFITQGATQIFDFLIDSTVSEFTSSMGYEGSNLDLTLIMPDGTLIVPSLAEIDPNIEFIEGARYEIYRITNPMAGTWQIVIYGADVPPEGENFFVQVTAQSEVTLSLATDKDSYSFPEPVKIKATLEESGDPLTGADVEAIVTRPDNSQISLTLYDDGLNIHGDERPNDGTYTNYFTQFSKDGSYTVKAVATGTTSIGEDFCREDKKTVSISGVPSDTMPPITTKTVGNPKYGPDDEWVTSFTQFNLTATDVGSGVNKIYYRIWYSNNWALWMEYNTNFTLSGEGMQYIEYYSTDLAGNIEDIHNQTHYVDDTSPEITDIQDSPDPQFIGGCVNISCNITDAVAIDQVTINISGPAGFIPVNVTMNSGCYYYYNDSYIIPGIYMYFIWAKDILGNWDTSEIRTFEIIIPATIDIDPDTLNLNSSGKWITCYIELPEGYDVTNITVSAILLNDVVPAEDHPTNIGDYDNDGIPDLMVKFDRQAVQDILEVGDNVEITVAGELIDGTLFEGTDYIRVI